MILETTESKMWETGSYKPRNIGIGLGLVVFAVEGLIIQPCFATEIRGSVRPTSG